MSTVQSPDIPDIGFLSLTEEQTLPSDPKVVTEFRQRELSPGFKPEPLLIEDPHRFGNRSHREEDTNVWDSLPKYGTGKNSFGRIEDHQFDFDKNRLFRGECNSTIEFIDSCLVL